LPLLSQALARGELSYAKVRELTRVATPETEEQLLAVGRAGTSEHVERIVRAWRRMDAKAEAQETARQHAGRALHVYQDEDGMVKIRGRLTAEVGAVLMKALDAAREALYQRRREDAPEGDAPTMAQQQADTLAVLAETALHKGLDPGTPAERYQVVVHVDATVLADASQSGQSELEDGMRVPAGTSQRLACDATRVVMRHEADVRVTQVGAVTSAAWGVPGGAVSENGRLRHGAGGHPGGDPRRSVLMLTILAGRMELIATIEGPAVIGQILAHLDVPRAWHGPAPACAVSPPLRNPRRAVMSGVPAQPAAAV